MLNIVCVRFLYFCFLIIFSYFTVIEQYIEFSWASQEQNGKMKITLTWTNVEMKRSKSKATRKRDRKRHEQYIEQKKVTENNKKTEIFSSRLFT
jgi:predicted tellurium resistance membrane protein TerC